MRNFHLPGRSAVYATGAMCATSHPLAAKVAVDILQQGGNAVDAAIAGAVLLGICEPQMTGLGGDCFCLISEPGKPVEAFNGSGRAPAGACADALRARGLTAVPLRGPEAVTIPGAVDLFCSLSETHGRAGLDKLLAPSIAYAEQGIPVAPRVAFDWHEDQHVLGTTARQHYLRWGRAPTPGTLFRAPGQAQVLRRIARSGRQGFYEGEVAADMLSALNDLGGVHTPDDFIAQRSVQTAPLSGAYGDIGLLEHPPNGQGVTAVLLLNILSHFDLAGMNPTGATRAHIEAEAAKLAYDARNRFVADPAAMADPGYMVAPETGERLAALINPGQAMESPAQLSEAVHKDTVYITVVDQDRMAVSLIYSVFHGFGSGIASEKFGILLHNRGAGFSLTQGHPNELKPGKRPMHTIIPAMLTRDDRVWMPFGVMGGGYQPTGHAWLVSNLLDYGMELQAAIDAPRCFADGDVLKVECGYPLETCRALEALGHKITTPRQPIGGAQAIMIRDDGVLEGASDPRKDGCALGY